jgi:small subunit ribosomal protein S3
VFIDVQEVRKAETTAQLVPRTSRRSSSARIAFRRAMKKAMTTAMKFGAKGIRVRCAGRLGGSEMGRVDGYREVACRCTRCAPTSTTARPRPAPPYGVIGVKVWIFKGEVLQRKARRIWSSAMSQMSPEADEVP